MENDFKFFDNYMDWQKKSMDAWSKFTENFAKNAGSNMNPFLNYEKMMGSFINQDFFNYTGSPFQVINKIKDSSKIYYDLYKLYKDSFLDNYKENQKFIDEALENFKVSQVKFINNHIFPLLPLDLQDLFKQAYELTNTYKETANIIYGPWMDASENLVDSFMKGALLDPEGFLEFFNIWKENYKKTYEKLLNAPQFGIDRNTYQVRMQTFDRFIKFIIYFAELNIKLNTVVMDTTEDVVNSFVENVKNDNTPKTFEEFYEFWKSNVSKNFDKLFYSDEFSKFLGNYVDSLMFLKKDLDKLIMDAFKNLPIPTNEDMDSLYKSVYDLKKEIRNLKRELREKDKDNFED